VYNVLLTFELRWPTLAACVVASGCCGVAYAWSVYLKPMAAAHGWSGGAVSLSYTALMSTAAVMALVAGWALQHVRPRTLMLIGGALLGLGVLGLGSARSLPAMYTCAGVAGVGLGTVYPGATMANLIRHFPDRPGLASGLLTAGAGVGGMILGPLSVALIRSAGLTWTLAVLGASFVVIVAACSRIVETAPARDAVAATPRSRDPAADGPELADVDWRRMLRLPRFYLLLTVFLLGTTSGALVISQAAPIVQDTVSATARAAGVAVTYLSLGMILGKLGWGWLCDLIGRHAVLVLMFVVAVTGLLVMIAATSYAPLVAGLSAVALCYGGFVSVIRPFTAEAFGHEHLPVNFGVMFLSLGGAAYAGPQLGALVAETGGGYSLAFIVAAAVSALGLLLAGIYVVVADRELRRRRPAPDHV